VLGGARSEIRLETIGLRPDSSRAVETWVDGAAYYQTDPLSKHEKTNSVKKNEVFLGTVTQQKVFFSFDNNRSGGRFQDGFQRTKISEVQKKKEEISHMTLHEAVRKAHKNKYAYARGSTNAIFNEMI
jgi:hypothetical protein